MMFYVEFWFVLAVMCFLGELLTGSFFLLWFGISALVVSLCSFHGFDPLVQLIIFILLSLALIGLSRTFTKKISRNSPRKAASDRLIRKDGVVIDDILSPEDGLVKVDGDVWRTKSSESIKKSQIVTLNNLESVKVDVKYKGGRKL
jgi:membrane protein implicated in regulation of membrane protease activity